MLKRSIIFCCGALLGVALLTIGVRAESIDGTTGVVFQRYNHVFRDGDEARGFVYFADGFTVLPDAAITMDCVTSVSGAIDLRGTGAVHLARDLALDSHVTLSDGGYFSSAGKGLVLGGNLRIPSGKVVHCAGDMVINGMGNTLHLEKDSQLFLDNQSTLTLRNMIIKTERSYPGQPALHVSTSLSKLCLDNVVLNLGNDLYLNKGQFFFHNDVLVTGTSALVYTSPVPSFVDSGSSLYFDHGTTFSYAPCIPSGNFLQLADASSTLAFDGATLKATGTGMQITRGQVALNGEVGVEQRDYVMTLNTTAVDSLELQNAYSVSWAPNGKYVAIAFWSNGVQLYSVIDGQLYWVQTISLVNAYALCWSPDGKYLVVGRQEGSSYFELYSFNQEGFLYWVQQISTTTNSVKALSWSPDGKFLAVGLSISNNLKLYRFANGQLAEVQTIALEYQPHCLSWSPDGKFLAVGRVGNGYDFRLYRFTNGQLYHAQTISDLYHVRAVSWSPDGKYVVVGVGTPSNNLKFYRFTNGQLQNDGTVQTIDLGSPVYAASWSPDGKYVVVGALSSGLKLYRFRNGQLQNDASVQTISVTNVYSLSWPLDQQYLAVGRDVSSGTTLLIYETLFTSQAPERPIAFGDGVALENNCAIAQAPASTVNILNGELRIAPVGHALPSDPLNNVISGGTWKLDANGAQRFGPGRYVDGSIVYRDAQSLADGFTYNGLINFAQGFSVPAGDRVSLDLLQPVFGDINLHDTASLVLENDLVLASGTQLVSGGTLEADGATLLLQGDALIPAGKVIHCAGDMVIDGGGRTLQFEPHAQLMVDANATVTLRNIIITPEHMGAATPALECDATGKLCLDNVVLNLSNDLQIDQGTVFVHNDVVVSGTSALLYQSPQLLSVAPHGTLYFDTGTTFSFAPKSTALERLHLSSATSRLMFNGADFITTGDDLQVMRGQVLFDGLSHLEHYGAVYSGGNWLPATDKSIIFGDGVNPEHDCDITMYSGARVLLKGNLVYNPVV